ncbi:MAG: tetratricopeptide repeat protein [Selenomonadaceae bacterium]|nr:tetratricopeptide repeat protein [Selenomonadaceae bacterium]
MTKTELFLKLAQPDGLGYSRWVAVDEFVGGYSELKFGNGASWARKESTLAKKFKIEINRSLTAGNRIDAIRLVDFNEDDGRAKVYYNLKDYNKAIADCTKAIELYPNNGSYYNMRASAYYNLKDFAKAITDYTKVIELSPEKAVYYKNRGSAYNAIGDNAKSQVDFEKAKKIENKN